VDEIREKVRSMKVSAKINQRYNMEIVKTLAAIDGSIRTLI
jgi:hypothetical protein